MEHGAKPPGSFLPTPCFRPIKHLRLRALDYTLTAAYLERGVPEIGFFTQDHQDIIFSEIAGILSLKSLLKYFWRNRS
jgi:hypothetical protein